MKSRRESTEIFSLSFLDIVSCGFGAVVLLVLISKPLPGTTDADIDAAAQMLKQVMAAEDSVAESTAQLSKKQTELASLQQISALLKNSAATTKQQLGDKSTELKKLDGDLKGLSLVRDSLQRASIRPSSATERDIEVGGIPVDSDYIIFIVDTSGSMINIWSRVSRELVNVLKIHPKVKGFQILNDNGNHLISSYAGNWIPDTPKRRRAVMRMFKSWKSASNSSPVEGLEVALKKYAKPDISLSVYIFGDDYSGSSYNPVLDAIGRLNRNRINGKRLAKIHAVGFMSKYTTNRFSILMRELTKRNGGTFLALRP
ncbi:MAG: VWA domain-containing protein [Mariprofundaceae bacterium]